MLRRFLIAVLLATTTLLGSARVSTAQDDAPAFRDLATGGDYRLRVAAALALGKSQSPNARGALEKALKDPHPAVRAAAAAALGARGDAAAVPALQAALGGEATATVRAQIESSVQRLSKKAPSAKVKFLVSLGKFENRSGVKDTAIGGLLKDETRAKVAQVPGIELLAEGADLAATAKSRKLPAFTLDGSVTQLAKGQSGADVTYSAKVEYLIRKMPEQALKGSMSGAAKALADARQVRGPSELLQLQRDALAGAVESALKGASPALEAASGK
ncbi:MAG: HEAT repeat domain-containing protein [Polyangiaceae bacterium]|nr:HEAT repeat domain-containing protein [Polyangiaceae bacterium]